MKTPKHLPQSVSLRVVIGIVLSSILITGSVLYYVWAATAPTSPFWINGGIYPGAPSYTVWRESSTYFAKDANGLLAYSNTDASTMTQTIINTFTSWGGSIYLVGELTYTTALTVGNTIYPLRIYGEGYSNQITFTGSGYWLTLAGLYHEVSELSVTLGSAATGAIRLISGAYYNTVDHNTFIGYTTGTRTIDQYGVVVNDTAGSGCYWNQINYNLFRQLNYSISIVNGANEQECHGNILRGFMGYGYHISDSQDVGIFGGRLETLLGSTPATIGVLIDANYTTIYGLDMEFTDVNTEGYNFTSNGHHTRIFGGRINVYGLYVNNLGTDNLFIGDGNAVAWTWNAAGMPSWANAGQLCYNMTEAIYYYYNGTDWIAWS